MNEKLLYKKASDKFGENHQLCLVMEESAELIQAVNKILRYGVTITTLKALASEVADMNIMLEQLSQIFEAHNFSEEVTKERINKLLRLEGTLS